MDSICGTEMRCKQLRAYSSDWHITLKHQSLICHCKNSAYSMSAYDNGSTSFPQSPNCVEEIKFSLCIDIAKRFIQEYNCGIPQQRDCYAELSLHASGKLFYLSIRFLEQADRT